jgi:hypothetical protein
MNGTPPNSALGQWLQTMINGEQVSLRQPVAWLGDTITIRSASRLLQLAQPDNEESGSGDRSAGLIPPGLAALDRALANPTGTLQDRQRA